jgi:hypothetical protein
MPNERNAIGARSSADDELALFTCQEWTTLLRLRRRYHDGQDLWDERELARLGFLRWLRQTGRIES